MKQDDGLLLSGSLYLRNRRQVDSVFMPIGNVTDLKFESKTETKKRESRQKNQLGQVLDSVTMSQGTAVSWTFDTFNRDNLAFALSGEIKEIPNKVATETEIVYPVVKRGLPIQLNHEDIDASTLNVQTEDGETIAEGLIELNSLLGLLTIDEACDLIDDGDNIKVSYSTRARSGYEIQASTVSDFDFELKLDGYNHASGKDCVLHCASVKVAADGAIEWLKGDFASTSAKGDVVTVNGNKHAYTFREYD